MAKVFVAIFFALIAGAIRQSNAGPPELPAELQELIGTLHNSCVAETGVTEDAIHGTHSGNFPDDNNLKCYIRCVMDNMGVIEDDGTVDVEGMVAMIPPGFERFGVSVKTCGTKKGSDACDTVFQTTKCYYETDPEYFFLP